MHKPLAISSIDLRFVERAGRKILQMRRVKVSEHKHYFMDVHDAAVPASVTHVWGDWQDVPEVKDEYTLTIEEIPSYTGTLRP